MHMEMIYLLATIPITIDDQSITTLGDALLLCDFPGRQKHTSGGSLIVIRQIVHGGYLLVRHDQDMNRRKRVDIPEGGHQIILVDDCRRDFAADYLRENRSQTFTPPAVKTDYPICSFRFTGKRPRAQMQPAAIIDSFDAIRRGKPD